MDKVTSNFRLMCDDGVMPVFGKHGMITVRITLEMANMNVYYKNLVKRDGPRMGWQIKGLNISYIKFCIAKLQEIWIEPLKGFATSLQNLMEWKRPWMTIVFLLGNIVVVIWLWGHLDLLLLTYVCGRLFWRGCYATLVLDEDEVMRQGNLTEPHAEDDAEEGGGGVMGLAKEITAAKDKIDAAMIWLTQVTAVSYRIANLLSWKHRAVSQITSVIIVVVLFALTNLLRLVPFKWIYLVVVMFVFRPPFMRDDDPQLPLVIGTNLVLHSYDLASENQMHFFQAIR